MTKNRNRLLLLAGDGFSAFGTWIDFLAILTLAAYQFHVTPYQMAVVSAAGLLPGILAGPFIGRLCDRGNPKQILLASILLRVVATGAILFCHDYLFFVALVGLRSAFATVASPAINVMAVRSVDSTDRPRFYSILNVLNNSAKVLAPAIGTVSSSLTSEAVALVMSLVFSAASFVTFAFIRIAEKEPTPISNGKTGAPIKAPFVSLVPLLWVATTCAFFVFMVNNLVPLVLQQCRRYFMRAVFCDRNFQCAIFDRHECSRCGPLFGLDRKSMGRSSVVAERHDPCRATGRGGRAQHRGPFRTVRARYCLGAAFVRAVFFVGQSSRNALTIG
jgi:MFS family permease